MKYFTTSSESLQEVKLWIMRGEKKEEKGKKVKEGE